MSWYKPADVGFAARTKLADLGKGARLFLRLVALFGPSFRRFGLIRDQVHFLGNYSLAIITVSGLFVGFVLSLQGYYTLQRYGSSEALGLLVALSLVRELGPVITALLFAGLDPISLGTAARLIRQLNDTMGLTSIVVSHDLEETFHIADKVIILANGKIAAQGTPYEVRHSDDPLVRQFVNAEPDGPVRFHYPGPSVVEDFGQGLAP